MQELAIFDNLPALVKLGGERGLVGINILRRMDTGGWQVGRYQPECHVLGPAPVGPVWRGQPAYQSMIGESLRRMRRTLGPALHNNVPKDAVSTPVNVW